MNRKPDKLDWVGITLFVVCVVVILGFAMFGAIMAFKLVFFPTELPPIPVNEWRPFEPIMMYT